LRFEVLVLRLKVFAKLRIFFLTDKEKVKKQGLLTKTKDNNNSGTNPSHVKTLQQKVDGTQQPSGGRMAQKGATNAEKGERGVIGTPTVDSV
jgi:hypothetical protein